MGLLARIGFAVSALFATCAGGPPPETDVARVARIDEMYGKYATEFDTVPSVTAQEVLAARERGEPWILVDTRTKRERAVSIIPDAIPASEVQANPDAFVGKELVAYCTIGYRSGLWAEKMTAKGLTVSNLEGSLLSWTHAGGTLHTPEGQPTKRVHVYGKPWNLAQTDYEAVW